MKNVEEYERQDLLNKKKGFGARKKLHGYKSGLPRYNKKDGIRIAVIAGIIIAIVFGCKTIIDNHKYKTYKVVGKTERMDASGAQYVQMEGGIFRYSANGASLVGKDKRLLWEQSYEMQNPLADECDETVAIYAQKGNQIYIFNNLGLIGKLKTELPVMKVRVTQQGMIGAILEDGENTWINFYTKDGSMLATAKTRVDNPGYPVDFAVSNDGRIIMVSYLFVEGKSTTSHIAFYNLDKEGKKSIDNIVSGYKYKKTVIPQVSYLNGGNSIAFREDGFSVYSGDKTPKESAKVKIEKEIISTFYNENYVGLVFVSGKSDKKYNMEVYNLKGKKIFSKLFNVQYDKIKVSDDQIIMYNEAQLAIFSMQGVEKFNGNIDEGKINDVFRSGTKEYMLVLDNGISTITLK